MSARAAFTARPLRLLSVAGFLGLVTVLAGTGTLLFGAASARHLLAVHFTRLPGTLSDAAGIWLHNLRATVGVAVLAAVDPLRRGLLDGARPLWHRLLVAICDVMLAGWAVGSSAIAGVLLAAYGMRQLAVFFPDGPVEVTAWLLLLVLYLDLRRGRVPVREAAGRIGLIVLLLAIAAVLEVGV
jgi:hypothetical protein